MSNYKRAQLLIIIVIIIAFTGIILGEKTTDKLSCYTTIYDIFIGIVKTLAPFIPFITEEIYQNIKTDEMPESIHLCDYLKSNDKTIDKNLEKAMERIRLLVEDARALRAKIGIKVRYPLSNAILVCEKDIEDSIRDLVELLNEEINVKNISFSRDTSDFTKKIIKPNHSKIGPRFKDKAKVILEKIENMDKNKLYEKIIIDRKF